MRGLYAIIDTDTLDRRGLDPLRFGDAILRAQPAAVQLRAKNRGAADTLSLLRSLSQRARAAGIPLFANDRPDLAALARADGVHLGQRDLPVDAARHVLAALGSSATIGMSVHDEGELAMALAVTPDYIALGPVFDTASKHDPEATLGLAGLEALAKRARARTAVPLVAIGGIGPDRVREIAAICPSVAAIGALVGSGAHPYDDATQRARAFIDALAEADGST